MARAFDTIRDILRSLSLARCLLRGRYAPICRQWAQTHIKLSRTDGLIFKNIISNPSLRTCVAEGIKRQLLVLVEWAKGIPAFAALTIDDQVFK